MLHSTVFTLEKYPSQMLNFQEVLRLQQRLVANLSDTHPRISRKYPAKQGMDVELLSDIYESISCTSSFASKELSQKCFLLLKVPFVANLCKTPVASSRTHVSKQDTSFQNLKCFSRRHKC